MARKERKDKKRPAPEEPELPVDLAARIGRRPADPAPPPPPAPAVPETPTRLDGPQPPRRPEGPVLIGMDEPQPPVLPAPPSTEGDEVRSAAIPAHRPPPGPGETDLVVTPLPTPDDWHRFELALRRVRGVGHVSPEYYRHGVLKVRVAYEGAGRLAQALRDGVAGYRIRVIGEDRSTLQILVSAENEERRPG